MVTVIFDNKDKHRISIITCIWPIIQKQNRERKHIRPMNKKNQ